MDRKPPGRESDRVRELLNEMRVRASAFNQIVIERFGEGSQLAYRAEELVSALQRLEWEVDRQQPDGEAASGG